MAETDVPVLHAAEQRVLGSLMEKQLTVPSTYPLTLNALRSACNQTSSRDPVVDYDDRLVEDTARALKARGLVRVVWAERGSRTLKYHQLLDERLSLQPDERALVTVLLLRGAQAPGELRTRTERLYSFADRGEVEACLHRMAALPTPIVRELELRPGQQDRRWIHLLGPVPLEPATGKLGAAVDREVVLAQGAAARDARVVAAYDAVAGSHPADLIDAVADQPFERWLLRHVAEAAGSARVAVVGCGPGQVVGFLADAGIRVTGFDLSPGMVEQARRGFPGIRFEVADLRSLPKPVDAGGWGAVIAWLALGHLAPSELREAVQSLVRVLLADGQFVLSVETGDQIRHLDQWWGQPVDLDLVLHDPRQVIDAVRGAGLTDVEWYLKGSATDGVTGRLFVIGRRAAA